MTTTGRLDYEAQNPYVVLRKSLKLTQEEVARLGGTTEQYVRRLEQGMVSASSGAVAVALYHAGHAKSQHSYVRTVARSALRNLRALNPLRPYTGPLDYHNPQTFEKYVEAWFDYWMQVSRAQVTVKQLQAVGSVYAICRLLLLHPYVVQRYAKVLSNSTLSNRDFTPLPEPVIRALNDSQLPREVFDNVLLELS